MKKFVLLSFGLFILLFLIFIIFKRASVTPIGQIVTKIVQPTPNNPMDISYMRSQVYPGSNIQIEGTFSPGANYKRYLVSYMSDGLKIYGLLAVPNASPPDSGFPAIVFNHGYITPQLYTPDGNYVAYVDAFAKAGYVVFKPNYRGNGKSEGQYGSAYFGRNYDIDDLNAISSLKKYPNVNSSKIGVWGHSMGGHITLMDLVINKDIKVAVIWSGVIGSYNEILYNWQNRVAYHPDAQDLRLRNQNSTNLIAQYGNPSQNPNFWNSIDPVSNLNYVDVPVQLHVVVSDSEVPADFSANLYTKLKSLGKTAEFYTYPGTDHNIGGANFGPAMQRTISFFDKYLK